MDREETINLIEWGIFISILLLLTWIFGLVYGMGLFLGCFICLGTEWFLEN
jgi:hypothetical protein